MTQTVSTVAPTVWSAEQQNVFTWFRSPVKTSSKAALVVRAFAGTGKTTTIIEAIRHASEAKILLAAFNKRIEVELNAKLVKSGVTNATSKTLHALGLSIVKKFWPSVRVDFGSERADILASKVCGAKAPEPIIKLVSKLHSKGREIAPHASKPGDLLDIAVQFECEPSEEWTASGFDVDYVEAKALEAMELACSVKPMVIDGADMIFLPVRNGWASPQYDLGIVDEAQDMTPAQLELFQGVVRGRIVVVGDSFQAIYGFRGADSESLDRLKTELNAEELTLSTTYRCGRAIVELAQQYVPNFRAAATNSAGNIQSIDISKLTVEANGGDFILSRTNAPLVSVAMKLLREGKRARIAGKDIGRTLITLVNKLAKGRAANSVPEFIERVTRWQDKEITRLERQLSSDKTKAAAERKIELVRDQADMLLNIAETADSVDQVCARIEALFTDDGLGIAGVITCSSVHKAKGLEASRVFILKDTLRNDSQEENNIAYVAITRAIDTLVWVRKGVQA